MLTIRVIAYIFYHENTFYIDGMNSHGVLNSNDRSVGPCPLRGKGGAVGTKGGVFPSPEGRLYGFLNTKRNKNIDSHQISLFIPPCI